MLTDRTMDGARRYRVGRVGTQRGNCTGCDALTRLEVINRKVRKPRSEARKGVS